MTTWGVWHVNVTVTKNMHLDCVIQNIQEWWCQTKSNMRYLQNTFSDVTEIEKIQKIVKNLKTLCDHISARIAVPNTTKHKIFSKYCFGGNGGCYSNGLPHYTIMLETSLLIHHAYPCLLYPDYFADTCIVTYLWSACSGVCTTLLYLFLQHNQDLAWAYSFATL